MTSLIQAGKTKRGRPAIIDYQHFSYVSNGPGSQKVYSWRCSNRKCDATLGTRKSSGNLVGDTLPSHQHGNQLMKKTAKKTESAVLLKYAGVQGATPSTVLQEISYNMLSSNFPGQLSSSSTAGAIRMKLWRQRQVISPRPKLPSSFEEYMDTDIPDKFTKAADGGEFLIYKDWIDVECTQPMAIFINKGAQAVFSICAKVFPTVSHKGCRFHHNAAVWKNLGDHHLQELFNQNPRFQ